MFRVRSIVVSILPLLAACTIIPAAPVQQPRKNAARAIGEVMLPGDPQGNSGEKIAERAIREVLAQRGVRLEPVSDLQVEVALARRAPAVGFSDGGDQLIEARPQDGRIDMCRENIFRLSVAIVDRRSSAVAFRGVAERVRCGEPDAGDLAAMAEVALSSLQ